MAARQLLIQVNVAFSLFCANSLKDSENGSKKLCIQHLGTSLIIGPRDQVEQIQRYIGASRVFHGQVSEKISDIY